MAAEASLFMGASFRFPVVADAGQELVDEGYEHREAREGEQKSVRAESRVTSLRAARFTTRPPRHAKRKPRNAALLHWPGETHTDGVRRRSTTMPKFVGLKRCLCFTRRTNLLPTVRTAARTARSAEPVRSSRQSERPEMSALLGSDRGRPARRVPASWVRSAEPRRSAARPGVISKSSPRKPQTRSAASEAICQTRGSRATRPRRVAVFVESSRFISFPQVLGFTERSEVPGG